MQDPGVAPAKTLPLRGGEAGGVAPHRLHSIKDTAEYAINAWSTGAHKRASGSIRGRIAAQHALSGCRRQHRRGAQEWQVTGCRSAAQDVSLGCRWHKCRLLHVGRLQRSGTYEGIETMAYYLDLFSPETYEVFTKSRRDISGFRVRHQNAARRIAVGDKLICYMTRLSRWVGVLEVTSQ